MSVLRAELKLKNDALLKVMEKIGLNQSQLSRMTDVHVSNICDMVNLRYNPVENSEKELRITIALNTTYDEIFRPYEEFVKHKKRGFIKHKYIAEIPIENVLESAMPSVFLNPPDFNTEDFIKDFYLLCKKAGLNERSIKILEMHYGLNGVLQHTFDEIGCKFEITRERVRQITLKSIGKLRNYEGGGILKEYIGEDFNKL